MKLLIISAAFPPMRAGEADHALQLCWRLADRGLDVHVLTTKGSVEKVPDASFKVHPIMRDWSWSDMPRFARYLRRCSPDAVVLLYIGWIYNDHPMVTFAPTIARTMLSCVPFVTQFENAEGARPDATSLLARVLRKGIALWLGAQRVDYSFGTLLSDSDRIITLSGYHLVELSKLKLGLEKKTVLIPAPPLMRISQEDGGSFRKRGRESLKVQSEDSVIIYLGRIYPAKGIETLLQAFQLVASHRRNIHLVLVGGHIERQDAHCPPNFARDILQLPADLGVADKVTWTGEYAWDSDLPSIYLRASDICVLPYKLGVLLNNSSLAAAASHGLPIITTKGATLEPAFVHEENVYLCPPENSAELAAAIEALMDQRDLRERLSVGALKLAREWFSWERVVTRTIETFS